MNGKVVHWVQCDLDRDCFLPFLNHIRSNPGISTFSLPSILDHISNCPCVSLCSHIFISLQMGFHRICQGARKQLVWENMQGCQPQLLGMFYLLTLFVIVIPLQVAWYQPQFLLTYHGVTLALEHLWTGYFGPRLRNNFWLLQVQRLKLLTQLQPPES